MRMLMRIELPDEVGALAGVTAVLAGRGVNVLDLDTHGLADGRVADELVLDVPDGVGGEVLLDELRSASVHVCRLGVLDAHDAVDRVARALELACQITHTGEPAAAAAAAAALVGAESAWAGPAGGMPLTGAAARAMAEQVPVQAREPRKRLRPVAGQPPWVLAVPVELADAAVVVLARRSPRFSFTETARVQALLRIAEQRSSRVERLVLADGGTVDVRAGGRGDRGALLRLHARCSDSTRYRRYFTGMAALPASLAEKLLVTGPGQDVLVAALGSELVGVAHAHRVDERTAEVALLVEDAHQRRGIGTALLRRLAAGAEAAGVDELVAITLPGNDPMRRVLDRLGRPVHAAFVDGLVRLAATLPAAPAAVVHDG